MKEAWLLIVGFVFVKKYKIPLVKQLCKAPLPNYGLATAHMQWNVHEMQLKTLYNKQT